MSLLLLLGGGASGNATVKVYDGAAFVAKPLKRWNGTAWVAVPADRLKFYDGATWSTA